MNQSAQFDANAYHVLLVSDANYSAFLATTIVSILKNAAPEEREKSSGPALPSGMN